jgi:hypothetical protein
MSSWRAYADDFPPPEQPWTEHYVDLDGRLATSKARVSRETDGASRGAIHALELKKKDPSVGGTR